MTQIGTKIKKVRELKNYTQDYMAEQLGVSQPAYSSYENSEVIKPELLDEIAAILNVKKEFIEQFDESTIFSNNTNTANDQAKSNLLIGNNAVTVNQSGDVEKEELYKKMIDLLEEKIKALEQELGKKK